MHRERRHARARVDRHARGGDFAVGGYVEGLRRVINAGTGVSVQGVRSSRVELHDTGAGDVKIGRLEVRDVNAELTGAGKMKLAGKAKTLRVHTTGSRATFSSLPRGVPMCSPRERAT